MILGYLSIAVLEILKEWKVAITLVGQVYESKRNNTTIRQVQEQYMEGEVNL